MSRKKIHLLFLCLFLMVAAYMLLSGRIFVLHWTREDSEIRYIPLGRSWIKIAAYDETVYSHEAYSLPAADLFSSDPIHFTLHCPGSINIPAIRVEFEGNTYFFMVDTGAFDNYGFPQGDVRDINNTKGVYDFLIDTDNPKLILPFFCPGAEDGFTLIPSNDSSQLPFIAGLLGYSWMRTHDNIVFDYQNQIIYFDQPAITENSTPMTRAKSTKHWWIPFEAEGYTEIGIVDTGCFGFFISKNFKKGKEPPKNLTQYILSVPPIEKKFGFMKKIRDIKIGSVELGTIKAWENDTWREVTNDRAQRIADFYSILGASLWKNHVIQLDFRNQVFRIK